MTGTGMTKSYNRLARLHCLSFYPAGAPHSLGTWWLDLVKTHLPTRLMQVTSSLHVATWPTQPVVRDTSSRTDHLRDDSDRSLEARRQPWTQWTYWCHEATALAWL